MGLTPPFSYSPLNFTPHGTTPSQHSSQNSNNGSTPTTPSIPLPVHPFHMPIEIENSLPTLRVTDEHFLEPVLPDIPAFIFQDLDVSRITRIYGYLWMAGRPMPARPLTRIRMIGYDVVPTDQADLHLLKMPKRILVKPLPMYLLSEEFWRRYLCADDGVKMHREACGFLLSYIWLIRSQLDLKIAKDLSLVPEGLDWKCWKMFVADFSSRIDIKALDDVDARYHFGELRLGRINTVYRLRFFHTNFVRGYLYEYNRYVVFFERNFGWLLGVFVYFSIILSAMQVGSSIPPLSTSHTFQRAAYGFVTFSIVAVVAFLVFIALVFSGIFMFNMVQAIGHMKKARSDRGKFGGGSGPGEKPSEIC